MLANLLDFDFSDPKSAEVWALSHAKDHDEIHQAILTQQSVNLENRALYPVNWKELQSFELKHQDAHNDMNAQLGLSGDELKGVDFQDQRQSAEWNMAHFREHLAARTKLGI